LDHEAQKNHCPIKPLYRERRYRKAAVIRFCFGVRLVEAMIEGFNGNALRQSDLSRPGRQASFRRPSQKLRR